MHSITSARYSTENTASDAPVLAIRNGREEPRRANDDIEGGGMLAYLAGGGVIDPFVPPPHVIPTSVSPYQARVALHNAELLSAVEATISKAPVPAQIAWEYATVFDRHSPFIEALAPLLGLTEQQIDELFVAASKVV